MELWRISNYVALDGEGGRLAPARWNSGGLPVVYTAASPAGALLEILVHLEANEASVPPSYTLLHITVPDKLRVLQLHVHEGETWKEDERMTRSAGDAWLASRATALARVPSSILPATFNYLLNPMHPDAHRAKIRRTYKAFFDPRLIRQSKTQLAAALQ